MLYKRGPVWMKKIFLIILTSLIFCTLILAAVVYFKKMNYSELSQDKNFQQLFIQGCVGEVSHATKNDVEDTDGSFKQGVQRVCLCLFEKTKSHPEFRKMQVSASDYKAEKISFFFKKYFESSSGIQDIETCVRIHFSEKL